MNKYQLIEVLDKGSYGIVHRARRIANGCLVAIKEFKIMPEVDVPKVIAR